MGLPNSLLKLLETRSEGIYGENGQLERVAEVWRPPAAVTRYQQADAQAALESLRLVTDVETVKKWLMALGTLVAKNMTVADAKVRIGAYTPGMVAYPPECFTRETLYQAGREFTWFPTYAEVARFMDERASAARNLAHRLKKIAEAPIGEPERPEVAKRYKDLTPDEQIKFDQLMDRFRQQFPDRPTGPAGDPTAPGIGAES